MSEPRSVTGVRYTEKDASYFASRELKRVAGPWKLWALGVGAVISGEFSGWNLGLAVGGFGGLLIATAIITVMYLCLCFSLAELAAALPHTGGAYSFARSSMGPWGGFVTGMAENMEYVFTPAVVVFFAGSYLMAIFAGVPVLGALPDFAWWAILYVLFVGLNVAGAHVSFQFSVFITLLALAILVVFFVGAVPHVDFGRFAFDIEPAAGGSRFLPFGAKGVLLGLPFAVWFYLGIEELPLAAEETHDPRRDMPRGILSGIGTLIVFAITTLVLNSAIAPGAMKLGASGEPVLDGLRTIFGEAAGRVLGLAAVAGLIASFHTIIFAFGRQICSLSRAGYFPTFLSITHPRWKTPHVALAAGGLLGWTVLVLLRAVGGSDDATTLIGGRLLAMAVFGGVVSYLLQMASFVLLRVKRPTMERPYVSPLGTAGAATAAAIAFVTLVTLFVSDPNYRWAAVGAGAWFLAGIGYFAAHGRHFLVLAPEERFALEAAVIDGGAPKALDR